MNLSSWQPSERSRDNLPHSLVSSFQVFLKYVHYNEAKSTADVSGIFSRPCFLEWMSTRPAKSIKHPPRSYQRVLYAHIRGADNRKPFPEVVEQELLKLLRDVDNNPWHRLFCKEKIFLGKRGFKSLGFHEGLAELSSPKPKKDDQIIRKRRIQDQDISWEKPILQISSPILSEKRWKSSNQQCFPDVDAFGVNSFFKYLERPLSNARVPWELMKNSVQTFVPPEERKLSLHAVNQRRLNFWSPALFYYLNQVVDPDDFRFSWSFIFPTPDQQHFRKGSVIGTLVHSTDKVLTHQNMNATQMFRGSVLNMHLCQIFASHVSLVYSFIKHVPESCNNGFVWRRDILQRTDKSRMVCLIHAVRCGTETILYIEDQSDLYPEVLKSFFLF